MNLQKGIVVAIANNFVEVKVEDKIYRCLIKGTLKFKATKILVGDYVTIKMMEHGSPLVAAILPRFNELYRPTIANIDQVLIVSSLVKPLLSSFLLNKLLTIFNFYNLKIILVFSKIDLVKKDDEVWMKVRAYQKLGFPTLFISNVTKEGIKDLTAQFPHKLSLLTGTSGVGKSSTLNSLNSTLQLWTQDISTALKRGKHTTTTSRLYFLHNGIIADTPGFSVFQLQGLAAIDIATNFPSFNKIWQQCKFRTCLHREEPQCAIKQAVTNKVIPTFFYEDYYKILVEFIKINSK